MYFYSYGMYEGLIIIGTIYRYIVSIAIGVIQW